MEDNCLEIQGLLQYSNIARNQINNNRIYYASDQSGRPAYRFAAFSTPFLPAGYPEMWKKDVKEDNGNGGDELEKNTGKQPNCSAQPLRLGSDKIWVIPVLYMSKCIRRLPLPIMSSLFSGRNLADFLISGTGAIKYECVKSITRTSP